MSGKIRYDAIGSFEGRQIDLVVTPTPGAYPYCSGSKGCYGQLEWHFGGVCFSMNQYLKLTFSIRYHDDDELAEFSSRRPQSTQYQSRSRLAAPRPKTHEKRL